MSGIFETIGCSRCGSTETVASRVAAVGAETRWNPEFVPPAARFFGTVSLPIKTKDGAKIWELRLCKNCVSKGMADFLAYEKLRTKGYIRNCLLAILLGACRLTLYIFGTVRYERSA